jgi:hypothetical protein
MMQGEIIGNVIPLQNSVEASNGAALCSCLSAESIETLYFVKMNSDQFISLFQSRFTGVEPIAFTKCLSCDGCDELISESEPYEGDRQRSFWKFPIESNGSSLQEYCTAEITIDAFLCARRSRKRDELRNGIDSRVPKTESVVNFFILAWCVSQKSQAQTKDGIGPSKRRTRAARRATRGLEKGVLGAGRSIWGGGSIVFPKDSAAFGMRL